jgi:hypothetical protein
MVKLVDTLASGASARKGVEVQVLFWAPYYKTSRTKSSAFLCPLNKLRHIFDHQRFTEVPLGTQIVTKTSAMHSYIQCRKDIYYFRYRVPTLLRPYSGKAEIKLSLETGSERETPIRSHHRLRIVDCLKQLNLRVRTRQSNSEEIPGALKSLFNSSRSHLPSSAPTGWGRV